MPAPDFAAACLAHRCRAAAVRVVAACAAAVAIAAGAAVATAAEPSDADFLAAKGAFERGDRARLAAFAPQFSGSLLEPYVAYWRLKLGLDAAARDDVRRYWQRWPDTPLADRLRVDWLKAVGQRADWRTFALDYLPPAGEDTELACYAIQFRRDRDGEGVLAEAKPLWFTGQSTPAACEPLFAALIRGNALTAADRRARFRLATEAGNVRLAQALAAELPPGERIAARQFAAVDRDPAAALARGDFDWAHAGGRSLALYALERAGRTDAQAVRAAWVRQRARLPEDDRAYGNGRLAFHAARQLAREANDWYREAGGAPLSAEQRAWAVRAALRASAWPDVLAAIDAMPPAQAAESAWRYWRARALAAAGRGDEASALHAALAAEPTFYGLLASEASGSAATATAATATATAAAATAAAATGSASATPAGSAAPGRGTSAEASPAALALAAFGDKPGVRRAVKLAALGLRSESQREWAYAIRGLDDAGLLAAAELARSNGMYDRAINTAERTVARHDYGLRYLTPFREHFTAAARSTDADPALLFGIARQESRFAPDIVSSAGAVGLMQLMPATARWVAKQVGEAGYRPSDIVDVATNTRFGAFYFKYWLDRLERLPALAAAAYNAGPGRAQAWRTGAPLEGAVWVETIPFNETRDYVKKVLANAMFYSRELNLPYQPLSARLGTIPPRGEGAPQVLSRAD